MQNFFDNNYHLICLLLFPFEGSFNKEDRMNLYKLTEEDEEDYEEGIGEDGRYIWVDKFGNITEYAKDGDEWYLVGSWEKETIINEFLPDPNIEVTKTYAPANPQTGDKVTYTITVKNTGNVPLDCGTGTLRNR